MKKVLKCVPSRFAKIINLGQKLGQSINFHSLYTNMRLRNMLRICLVFWKSEPQYAYKRYAYKKTTCTIHDRYLSLTLCIIRTTGKLSSKTVVHLEKLDKQ